MKEYLKIKRSFTLIELLVVIAIIGLLSSVILVSLSGPRQRARITRSLEFSQSVQHTIGNEAVGIWDFDDCTAKDLSGYKNDGTINGAVCVDDTPYKVVGTGQGKNALSFDGVDDYVDCGNNNSLDNENAISVEAWIKTSYDASFPGELGIVKKGTGFAGVSTAGWSFRLRDDIPSFALRKKDNSGYWDLYVGAKVIDGRWHHIVGTFDTSKIKRYVDGVLEQTDNTGQPYLISSEKCAIGVLNNNYFNGLIDDVRIYSTALSIGEIQQHYLAGLEKHKQLTIK